MAAIAVISGGTVLHSRGSAQDAAAEAQRRLPLGTSLARLAAAVCCELADARAAPTNLSV